MYYILGLGNPGNEYVDTRHNVGKMALDEIWKRQEFSDWEQGKGVKALVAQGEIMCQKTTLVFPLTFMNRSGLAISPSVTSIKKAEKLVVIYDDIDLPLGTIKISYGRGSGGHRGIESVIRSIKTKNFVRIRVGISPITPTGIMRKPKGDDKVLNHVMGEFTSNEQAILKVILKKVHDAVVVIVKDGKAQAMNEFN